MAAIFLFLASTAFAQSTEKSGKNPAEDLPAHITRATWFGERADWSHDGKKILFIEKTYGDAYEIELATKIIRPVTHHYPHLGYTRALYLANGDILLSGPETFDPKNPGPSRVQCYLYVLDRSLTKPPVPLGTKCSEGPAVSRKLLHIAWTHVSGQYPEQLPAGVSQMFEADIMYENGVPKLANQKLIIDSRNLSFKCTMETQNFRPPEERELTFSAYGHQGTDVCGIDLATKKVVNYSNAPNQYDEPEGIFPDGKFTLVECDRQNHQGSGHVDLWKLKLDGSGQMERLTYFSDYPGNKASNPVVSDDGRFVAFQAAKSRDPAGVGYGIFIYDTAMAKRLSGLQNQETYVSVPSFPQLPGAWTLGQVSAASIDSEGNIFVFHRGEHPILVFDKTGKFLRSFGDGLFKSAHGLRLDKDDNVWVTDNANHTVTKFSHDGKIIFSLGVKDVPGNDARHFNKPTDVAFAPNGDFFVSDGYGNSRVVKFDHDGKFLFAWGKKGKGPGEFNLPHAVRLDSKGLVYVADRENDRIQVFDQNGKFQRQFGGFAPFGLFITPDDTVFVADGRANRILKMTKDGNIITSWGNLGSELGNFNMPHGIAVDSDGAAYVTEINGKRVQKFKKKN